MVSVSIGKGQGLTQGLQAYAKAHGYDVSHISKQDWANTISQLETIQNNRQKNNQDSIYIEQEGKTGWRKMLVHQGEVEFSDTEISNLLTSMGLTLKEEPQEEPETKAEAYEKWTVAIAQDPTKDYGAFQVAELKDNDIDKYFSTLGEFAESYIKNYDTNNDGKISYEEYEQFEVRQTKENSTGISQEDIDAAKSKLRTMFARLNVDNKNESKGVLDKSEIMNFFSTMDAYNDTGINDGKISTDEFLETFTALSDTSRGSSSPGRDFASRLRRTFDNLKAFFK